MHNFLKTSTHPPAKKSRSKRVVTAHWDSDSDSDTENHSHPKRLQCDDRDNKLQDITRRRSHQASVERRPGGRALPPSNCTSESIERHQHITHTPLRVQNSVTNRARQGNLGTSVCSSAAPLQVDQGVPATRWSGDLQALNARIASLEKKMFDNQMLILSELRSIRSAVTSAKETGVLRLPEDCPALPVSTPEELFVLDEYLSSEGKMEKLVHYYSRYGGTDVQDSTRTLLRNLLTKAVALQFSWKGSKGTKLAFAELRHILDFILSCLRANHREVSHHATDCVIKRWLIGAQDRDGGRSQRRVQKKVQEEERSASPS